MVSSFRMSLIVYRDLKQYEYQSKHIEGGQLDDGMTSTFVSDHSVPSMEEPLSFARATPLFDPRSRLPFRKRSLRESRTTSAAICSS